MKRIIALLAMMALMVTLLAACNSNKTPAATEAPAAATEEPAAEATEEPAAEEGAEESAGE